jgi:GAF domain-containing protein
MNPESAADYVANTNLKGLIEWLTAETILTRPEDPVQFCRDILGQKLVDRGHASFHPLETSNWLRGCYAKATAEVDEHGIIHGENIEPATASVSEHLAMLKVKMSAFQTLMNSAFNISKLDTAHVAHTTVREVVRILNCDRAVVYLVDNVTNELLVYSSFSTDDTVHRVAREEYDLNASAMGDGEVINLADVYSDNRFDKNQDRETGYETSTLLVAPLKCPTGEILGTIHAINKRDMNFKHDDEELLTYMSTTVAIAIRNAEEFRATDNMRRKQRDMHDITTTILRGIGDQTAINTCIAERAKLLVDADRCVIYCVDEKRTMLFEIHDTGSTPMSLDRGLVASVISTGTVANLTDAYENPLFSAVQDKQSGYRTKAVLCIPLKIPVRKSEAVIGALYFTNKVPTCDYSFFTPLDVTIAQTFCDMLGPFLVKSAIYRAVNSKKQKTDGSDSESEGEGADEE